MIVEVTEANRDKCICPECATYDECMTAEDELLYCATGKTVCEPEKIECICGDCPVWVENGLKRTYFCLIGAAE